MAVSSSTVACGKCGALNDNDFQRCIRCNQKLDNPVPAEKAARRVPAPRRRGLGGQSVWPNAHAKTGPGSEPLLGRWPAELVPAGKLLLFLNLVVFAVHISSAFAQDPGVGTLLSGGSPFDAIPFGALPLRTVVAPGLDPLIVRAEWWRILSACFVHFGALHVGMNMMALIYFAQIAEPMIGSIRFIIAYTLTGIGGYLASAAWFFLFQAPSITAGASGAIFGIMGLILGFFLRRRDPRWKAWFLRMVVLSFAVTIVLPMKINHSAHLGGLVVGVGLGAWFGDGAPQPSKGWQRGLAAVCILASLAALLASRLSPYNIFFAVAG